MTESESESRVRELLGALAAEQPAESPTADDASREQRMALHLDRLVTGLNENRARQRRAVRRWVPLLVAAGFAVVVLSFVWRRAERVSPGIAQEPPIHRLARETPRQAPKPTQAALRAPTIDSTPTVHPPPPRTVSAPAIPSEVPPPVASNVPSQPGASTLNEENRLFQQAAQAERSGQTAAALGSLNQLARQYPRSPLAQNAMVQRFRLLSRAGRAAEASAAANEYLSAFPQGFAQQEAQSVSAGHPTEVEHSERAP